MQRVWTDRLGAGEKIRDESHIPLSITELLKTTLVKFDRSSDAFRSVFPAAKIHVYNLWFFGLSSVYTFLPILIAPHMYLTI